MSVLNQLEPKEGLRASQQLYEDQSDYLHPSQTQNRMGMPSYSTRPPAKLALTRGNGGTMVGEPRDLDSCYRKENPRRYHIRPPLRFLGRAFARLVL